MEAEIFDMIEKNPEITIRMIKANLISKLNLTEDEVNCQSFKQKIKSTVESFFSKNNSKLKDISCDESALSQEASKPSKEVSLKSIIGNISSCEEDTENSFHQEVKPQKEISSKQRTKKIKTDDKKSPKEKGPSDSDIAKLNSLKKLVNLCGVRRQWKRIFGDANIKEQIRIVKNILIGLGIEGRPTIEKCKKVKKELEMKEEMASIDTSNIISSKRGTLIEESESSDSEASQSSGPRTSVIDFSRLGDSSSE